MLSGWTVWRMPYNAEMTLASFDELKSYVSFEERDAANVVALAPLARPLIPGVVSRFYEVLLRHPAARAVFSGGLAQVERLKQFLRIWLQELFAGCYDDSYYQSRFRIGRTHVRVGLPQKFMPLAMEVIGMELSRRLTETGEADIARRLISLHKLLTLDLTIMLDSYHESYTEQVREAERRAIEVQMARTQHLAEIGQLAASLAHEVKNPLAGISGAIQIIGESLTADSPYKSVIHAILGQISRLDATVKDLLLFARPTPLVRQQVKLGELVRRTVGLLREEPALRDVNVRFLGPDTSLHADEGQLEQLLMNLVLNAAHASPDGSTIDIEVDDRGPRLVLVIRDHGAGMPPAVRERALEPFFTTKAKGTGLGLAICRRIVESHEGTICIRSEPGEGTSVTVDLPRGSARSAVGCP